MNPKNYLLIPAGAVLVLSLAGCGAEPAATPSPKAVAADTSTPRGVVLCS